MRGRGIVIQNILVVITLTTILIGSQVIVAGPSPHPEVYDIQTLLHESIILTGDGFAEYSLETTRQQQGIIAFSVRLYNSTGDISEEVYSQTSVSVNNCNTCELVYINFEETSPDYNHGYYFIALEMLNSSQSVGITNLLDQAMDLMISIRSYQVFTSLEGKAVDEGRLMAFNDQEGWFDTEWRAEAELSLWMYNPFSWPIWVVIDSRDEFFTPINLTIDSYTYEYTDITFPDGSKYNEEAGDDGGTYLYLTSSSHTLNTSYILFAEFHGIFIDGSSYINFPLISAIIALQLVIAIRRSIVKSHYS